MNISLGIQFISQLMVAIFGVILLKVSSVRFIITRALLVCFAVTAGAFLTETALWNWWAFPDMTTLVNIADVAISWFLGGLAMGSIIKFKQH